MFKQPGQGACPHCLLHHSGQLEPTINLCPHPRGTTGSPDYLALNFSGLRKLTGDPESRIEAAGAGVCVCVCAGMTMVMASEKETQVSITAEPHSECETLGLHPRISPILSLTGLGRPRSQRESFHQRPPLPGHRQTPDQSLRRGGAAMASSGQSGAPNPPRHGSVASTCSGRPGDRSSTCARATQLQCDPRWSRVRPRHCNSAALGGRAEQELSKRESHSTTDHGMPPGRPRLSTGRYQTCLRALPSASTGAQWFSAPAGSSGSSKHCEIAQRGSLARSQPRLILACHGGPPSPPGVTPKQNNQQPYSEGLERRLARPSVTLHAGGLE